MTRSIYAGRKVVPLPESLWERGDHAWDRHHFDEAERLFRLAAKMGHVTSMDSLGTLLDDRGQAQEAVRWYKRAVAAGYSQSAWNLAMHYLPLGQRRWYRYWINRAAMMGDKDAKGEAAKLAKNPSYMTRLSLEDTY